MGMRDTVVKKLQQATCDKPELNRRFLQVWKSLKDVEQVIQGGGKKKEKQKSGH